MTKFKVFLVFIVVCASGFFAEVSKADLTSSGLRQVKVVLQGVLYRGGGSGGMHPLTEAQLQDLCEAGFSGAGYLYSDGMLSSRLVSCRTRSGQSNVLSYRVYGYRTSSERHAALQAIHNVIVGGGGPLFMHCWNGMHAAGEMAAVALMQFCGWSGSEAGRYWINNISDTQNMNQYRNVWEKHIANFQPFSDLILSAAQQARVCPSR